MNALQDLTSALQYLTLTGPPLRPLLWGSMLSIQSHVALVKLLDDHAGARCADARLCSDFEGVREADQAARDSVNR